MSAVQMDRRAQSQPPNLDRLRDNAAKTLSDKDVREAYSFPAPSPYDPFLGLDPSAFIQSSYVSIPSTGGESIDSGYYSMTTKMPRTASNNSNYTMSSYQSRDSGYSSVPSPDFGFGGVCPSLHVPMAPQAATSHSTISTPPARRNNKSTYRRPPRPPSVPCREQGCRYSVAFRNEFDLRRHNREVHKVSPFDCPVVGCNRQKSKGYLREADLKNHLRAKHDQSSIDQPVDGRDPNSERQNRPSQGPEFDEEPSVVAEDTLMTDLSGAPPGPREEADELIMESVEPTADDNLTELSALDSLSAPQSREDPASVTSCDSNDADSTSEGHAEDSSQTTIEPFSAPTTRAPSPWQNPSDGNPNRNGSVAEHLSRSLAWILSSTAHHNDGESSTTTTSSTPGSSENAGFVSCKSCPRTAAASESHSSSPEQGNGTTGCQSTLTIGNDPQSSSGTKRSRGTAGDGEDTGDEPPPKQTKIIHDNVQAAPVPLRFACPYNKWDPQGCPLCCAASNRNRAGGAGSFPRVKSHMFRNHDLSVRCLRCWGSFTKPGALEDHTRQNSCVLRASPTKYWMTEDQRSEVRGQRFVGSDEENWYHLFKIVLPEVPLRDPMWRNNISPYYVSPDLASLTQALFSGPFSFPSSQSQDNGGIMNTDFGMVQPTTGHTNTGSFVNAGESIVASPSIVSGELWPSFHNAFRTSNVDSSHTAPREPVHNLYDISTAPPPSVNERRPLTVPAVPSQPPATVATSSSDASSNTELSVNSSQFLRSDNERLRQTVRQLRKSRDDWQRRADTARNHLGSLESLVDLMLSHNGLPADVCNKLFEASNILVQFRKDIN